MTEEKPPQPGRLQPTVMKPPKKRSRERKASSPAPDLPPAPGIATPTVVAGVRRQRIEVDIAGLRVLAPDAPAPVCQAALQMIREVVDSRMSERKAVLWGHEAQKAYGERVTGTFSLAQDPVVEQARAWVSRMTAILGAIDLMAVCGHGKGGLLGSVAKAMSNDIDTPRELSAALDELRLLLERTGAAIDRLLQLKERLQQQADAIGRIEVEIESAALAALFLSGHFAARAPELAQLFTERSMSLNATLAQMRQSSPIYRMQLQQPLQLIAAIQNVALVSLPGCIAGMSALLTLLSAKGASPTEVRDMSYQLRDLLSQLNI
ncbi:hypothetical protein GCM10027431_27140 [Lysobacter rhizosphaerae]